MTTTKKINLKDLLAWGRPTRIETKYGPRDLHKAFPTQEFWDLWKENKEAMRRGGISCKDFYDNGQVYWWAAIGDDEKQKIKQAQKASRATASKIKVPCPSGMKLYPHQIAAVEYALPRKDTLFACEMGVGKTAPTIGVSNCLPEIKRILVICPASLKINWSREFAMWDTKGLSVSIISGGKAKDWTPDEVTILNYALVTKHRKRIDKIDWDMLVCDESHYCSNANSQRTRAILGHVTRDKHVVRLPISAGRRIFLSGTPIENRPKEFWTVVEAFDPHGLGSSFFSFAKRFCDAHHNGFGWQFNGSSNLELLQRLARERFMIRRLKSEVLTDLPDKQRQVLELPATGYHDVLDAERKIWDDYLAAKESGDEKQAVQLQIGEMARIRHDTALAKVPAVVKHIKDSIESGPVVCFAWHHDVIANIAAEFGDQCVVVTGDTNKEQRQEAVDKFQAGEVDLFLGNMLAAGVGITLTKSSHVVFAELDWVPGKVSQAEDRLHRVGQKDSVLVQHIVIEDSIDFRMAKMITEKQGVLDAVLDHNPEIDFGKDEPIEVETKSPSTDDTLSDKQIAAVYESLHFLAARCDGACSEDGEGYNKMDSEFGAGLTARAFLTPGQVKAAARMLHKYRRQLPDGLYEEVVGVCKRHGSAEKLP